MSTSEIRKDIDYQSFRDCFEDRAFTDIISPLDPIDSGEIPFSYDPLSLLSYHPHTLNALLTDLKILILDKCEINDSYNLHKVSLIWKDLQSNPLAYNSILLKFAKTIGLQIQPGKSTKEQLQTFIENLCSSAKTINPKTEIVPNQICSILSKIPSLMQALKKDILTESQINYLHKSINTLQSWLKARDTIIIWRALLKIFPETHLPQDSRITPISHLGTAIFEPYSISHTTQQAISFKEWFATHREVLMSLRSLNLKNMKLTSLPDELAQLTALEELDLSDNKFSKFPPVICGLHNLTTLLMNNTSLSSIPEEFKQLIQLKKVDFSGNEFESFPHQIAFPGNKLEEVYFIENSISSVPEVFKQLTKLKIVSFAVNKFKNFPHQIAFPGNKLEEVYLDDNKILSLEPTQSIVNFRNFKTLNIKLNNLLLIPPEIAKLPKLLKLNISYNKLFFLPSALYKCKFDSFKYGGNITNLKPPKASETQR